MAYLKLAREFLAYEVVAVSPESRSESGIVCEAHHGVSRPIKIRLSPDLTRQIITAARILSRHEAVGNRDNPTFSEINVS